MKTSGPVVIIGFKGCGKSTVGRALAEKLGLRFIDTDSIIERLYEERHGEHKSFREIFKSAGSDYFRAIEDEAAREALAAPDSVVSLGGGTLMGERLKGVDLENAVFVHVKVEKETLFSRIMKNGLPAFMDGGDPRGVFEKIFSERAPVYEKHADITVDNTDRSPQEVAEEIKAKLCEINLER